MTNRFEWAVETLAVKQSDQILEIGCGHGLAVTLICPKLTDGKITAIDRSDKMITIAGKKNHACVEAGKAEFHTMALDKATLDAAQFDKIFSINVNVFWMKPVKELAVIKRLLKPEGVLYLFYQPPAESKIQEIIDNLTRNLTANHFTIKEVLKSGQGICVIAELAD